MTIRGTVLLAALLFSALALGQANPFGPAATPPIAQLRAVPHGEIRMVWYDSSVLGVQRRLHVYLPPGYERGNTRYPVLYLIHGGGGDDASWSNGSRAEFTLDNLIAEGGASPMIVVMPNGSGTDPALNRPSTDTGADALAARTAASNAVRDRFLGDLTISIIPFVESHFRARTDRAGRAIAGFSFGGAESLWAGTGHADKFAWVGMFSMGIQGGSQAGPGGIAGSGSAVPPHEFVRQNAAFFADTAKTNRTTKLIWIGVGKEDTVVSNGPKQLSETLTAHGIRHEYREYEGGHSMNNGNLSDFASLLFR